MPIEYTDRGTRWWLPGYLSGSLLVLLALLGCDAPSDIEQQAAMPGTSVRLDSADVVIVVTPGAIAWHPSGWTIEASPHFRVGETGGAEPYLFYQIRGVEELVDGSVLVLDGGSRELRVFDRQGVFRFSTGGRGNGPGEYQQPRVVPTSDTNSILVYDAALARYTVYDRTGHNPRTLRAQPGPLAMADSLMNYQPSGLAVGHVLSHPCGWIGLLPDQPDGLSFPPMVFCWSNLSTGEGVGAPHVFPGPGVLRSGGRPASLPLQPMPSGTVYGSGYILSDGREAEVRQFDVEGRLARVLRVSDPRPVVTEDEFVAALRVDFAAWNAEEYGFIELARLAYRELPQPVREPSFDELLVDSEGWIWARLNDWARWRHPTDRLTAMSRWVVFDPEGQAHGTVDLPVGLEVHSIGADVVLGVRLTELGVEVVEGYRLSRGS